MQIVINILEEYYENILKNFKFSSEEIPMISLAIATGIPLPKGHGRLIDADNITFNCFFDAGDYAQAMRGIYDASTIIEADKENE